MWNKMEKYFKFKHPDEKDTIFFAMAEEDKVIIAWVSKENSKNIDMTSYKIETVQSFIDNKDWIVLSEDTKEIEEITADEAMKRLEKQSGKKVKIIR